jgi:hypothetical protein
MATVHRNTQIERPLAPCMVGGVLLCSLIPELFDSKIETYSKPFTHVEVCVCLGVVFGR